MSFLDDETTTTGQISLGTRRLGLDPLLPPRRRQAARQQQAPGYDILPSTMQPIPGVVSTPSAITQVGVGQQLQEQGTTAAQVPNVFERYLETGAAPIGTLPDYLYPQPIEEDEDEEENDVIEAANEEFAQNFGFDPSQSADLDYGEPYNIPEGSLLANLLNFFDEPTKAAATQANKVVNVLEEAYQKGVNALTGAQSASEAGYEFTTTTSTGQTVPTTESSGRTVTVGAMQGTPFGSTPDADAEGGGGGSGTSTTSTPAAPAFSDYDVDINAGTPSYSGPGGTGSGGGDAAAPGSTPDDGYGIFASGGTVTKSKSKTKNKNSFMSMKGK